MFECIARFLCSLPNTQFLIPALPGDFYTTVYGEYCEACLSFKEILDETVSSVTPVTIINALDIRTIHEYGPYFKLRYQASLYAANLYFVQFVCEMSYSALAAVDAHEVLEAFRNSELAFAPLLVSEAVYMFAVLCGKEVYSLDHRFGIFLDDPTKIHLRAPLVECVYELPETLMRQCIT